MDRLNLDAGTKQASLSDADRGSTPHLYCSSPNSKFFLVCCDRDPQMEPSYQLPGEEKKKKKKKEGGWDVPSRGEN